MEMKYDLFLKIPFVQIFLYPADVVIIFFNSRYIVPPQLTQKKRIQYPYRRSGAAEIQKAFCNLHVVSPEKKSKPSTYRAQITTSRLLKNSYLMSF